MTSDSEANFFNPSTPKSNVSAISFENPVATAKSQVAPHGLINTNQSDSPIPNYTISSIKYIPAHQSIASSNHKINKSFQNHFNNNAFIAATKNNFFNINDNSINIINNSANTNINAVLQNNTINIQNSNENNNSYIAGNNSVLIQNTNNSIDTNPTPLNNFNVKPSPVVTIRPKDASQKIIEKLPINTDTTKYCDTHVVDCKKTSNNDVSTKVGPNSPDLEFPKQKFQSLTFKLLF